MTPSPHPLWPLFDLRIRSGDMLREILKNVFDDGEFFEVHQYWAQNILCGFARSMHMLIGFRFLQGLGAGPRRLEGCRPDGPLV